MPTMTSTLKVDKGSGRMVIQVVDRETNTVIRQIPSKEIIEISKALEGKHWSFAERSSLIKACCTTQTTCI